MTDHETQGAVLTGAERAYQRGIDVLNHEHPMSNGHVGMGDVLRIVGRLAAALDEMRGALEAARHALVTYQGLSALDGFGTYYQAQDDGADQNGAFDALRESSWVLNDEATLAVIDAALAATSDAGDRQGESRLTVLADTRASLARVTEQARVVIHLAETTTDTVQYMGLPIDVSVAIKDLRRVVEQEAT